VETRSDVRAVGMRVFGVALIALLAKRELSASLGSRSALALAIAVLIAGILYVVFVMRMRRSLAIPAALLVGACVYAVAFAVS
jgi:xanthine/uracil permease